MHDTTLITTIAAAFTGAWLLGLVTQRLGLSPIVGYLLAGVLIGPHTPGFVGDVHVAQQLAEVGVILLMACTNVANLLLTRAVRRRHELSVRAALGAARGRLVRQLLAESLLLGVIGGALGAVLAQALLALVIARVPGGIASGLFRQTTIDPDPVVLAFTCATAVLSALVFGLGPALSASRVIRNDV